MILSERHIINSNHQFFDECDILCFKSKNLYNQSLYNVRQYFFENKKYLSFVDNFHLSKKTDSYKELPAKVSNQTLKMVDKNFKSFFGSLKNKKLKPRIPKYLDKVDGRYIAIYDCQAIGKKYFKKTNEILLSKTNIKIKTKINDFSLIKEVRIVPRTNHYVIEVIYIKNEKMS